MQVVTGDADQHVRASGIDRHRRRDHPGKRFRSLCIDDDAHQFVTSVERPADDDVAFGNEDPSHVAVRQLTLLTKHVVSKALEELEPGIVGVIDGNPVIEHSEARSHAECCHVP